MEGVSEVNDEGRSKNTRGGINGKTEGESGTANRDSSVFQPGLIVKDPNDRKAFNRRQQPAHVYEPRPRIGPLHLLLRPHWPPSLPPVPGLRPINDIRQRRSTRVFFVPATRRLLEGSSSLATGICLDQQGISVSGPPAQLFLQVHLRFRPETYGTFDHHGEHPRTELERLVCRATKRLDRFRSEHFRS